MRVTTIDHYLPEPGTFVWWAPESAATESVPSPVAPSFNQRVHLASAERGSTWLAGSFEVEGAIDHAALELAYRGLIDRHGSLRSSFVSTVRGPSRRRYPTPRLRRQDGVRADTATQLRDLLRQAFTERCRPFGFPAYLLGAIDRPERSTIICGFDHAHVDSYSIAIVIEDMRRLYQGFRSETLPKTGDFVDFCAEQAAVAPTLDDQRLHEWHRFFGTRASPPTFPLDLGLAPGTKAPQASDLRQVLDAAAVERFETLCRGQGSGVFAGCLAAMAESVRSLGGGDRTRVLFPMHTRHHDAWRHAVGWFTSDAPIEVDTDADPATAIRRTGRGVRAGIELGTLPLEHVVAALGGLDLVRDDIFMMSYIDYRRLPGATHHHAVRAQHISNVSAADDAQFWLSRTADGLALRSRYPDTAEAHSVIAGFLDEFQHTLLRFGAASHGVTGAARRGLTLLA
ncbi:condensation domain-containing protein [Nocardia callitridis]|uniref:Condensation domain-containing protein n=1 Tax=Nocardia callitridis TaxID=648753 RepID=A0ABP9KKR3_9NOCA